MVSTVLDEDTKSRLKDDIMEGAGGTFLWAGYIAHELSKKKTKKEILQSLQSLPKDLNALYDRMLHEIPTGDQRMCAKLLTWLVLALEPLRLNDLAEALELQSTQETTALEELEHWIQKCGHMVQVTGPTVSLIHQSAKDHLLDHHVMVPQTAIFRIDPVEGHCTIASRCIGYLEKRDVPGWKYANEYESTRQRCAFFAYAIDHGAQHTHSSSVKFRTLATKHPHFFDLTSGKCFKSIKCREQERLISYKLDKKYPMLIAAAEGVLEWAKYLYDRRVLQALRHPLSKTSWKKDVMYLPMAFGHLDVVAWLLDIGFDVNATLDDRNRVVGEDMPTLVLFAFEHENYNLIHLLIQRGALIYGELVPTTTLQHFRHRNCDTAEAWRQVFVGAFVRQGHRADPKEAYYWLKYCIEKNEHKLIRQLLTVDVDHRNDKFMCILEYMIRHGTFDESAEDVWPILVQRVIEEDKNFRAVHGRAGHKHNVRECWAPEWAAMGGHASALKTLLSYKCFITAIQSAKFDRRIESDREIAFRKEIIAILIDHDAIGKRTLAWVSERRDYDSAELLLSSGLDPRADSVFFLSVYAYASSKGTQMTPMSYAEHIQDDTMIALLTRFGAKRSSDTARADDSLIAPPGTIEER